MRRTAFTLFELMVVIAIIALLVSMLLPVIGMVRETARQIACASIMRQLGMVDASYANDHNGTSAPTYLNYNQNWLPGSIYGVHGWLSPPGSFWESWYVYLGENAGADYINPWNQRSGFMPWICPSAPFKPPKGQYGNHWWGPNSYGPNTAVLSTHSSTGPSDGFPVPNIGIFKGWPGYGIGVAGFFDNRRRSVLLPRQSETIQYAEHWGDNISFGALPAARWTDAVFVRKPVDKDGKDLTPPPAWGTWLSTWLIPADAYRSVAVRVSHRGRSNYLFHDGRVAAMTPWETCAPDPALPNMWTGTAP
jgi:prepilin-type N-terminal cleavage/methylation domain-containing protein/prepilin-type processing-associated H-X9-DG protein